jgi:hypothetical protein
MNRPTDRPTNPTDQLTDQPINQRRHGGGGGGA